MEARKPPRAGLGRKRGAKNKITAMMKGLAERAAAEGITPLDYMLRILREDPPQDWTVRQKLAWFSLRFEAAKAAAPYVHPRLASIEHNGKAAGPMVLNIVQFTPTMIAPHLVGPSNGSNNPSKQLAPPTLSASPVELPGARGA